MQPVITPEESARLDETSAVPVADLMERAGLGVALAAVRMGAGYGTRVAVLTGTGNNGGDGWVAARHLARRGCAVVVHSLGFPRGDDAPARMAAIRAAGAGVRVRTLGAPAPADIVIDALFGAGFRGELPDRVAPWTDHPAPVLAVDIPSGLRAADGGVSGPAFRAARTVTFHARKPGHLLGEGPEHCGAIEVVDIGLDHEATRAELRLCEDVDAPAPPRARTAHKWSAGAVLVVGGAPGMTGAALLAGRAALTGGAGAAALAVPGALQPIYAAMSAGLLTHPVGGGERFAPGDAAAVVEHAGRYDVVVLGPGLGRERSEFVAGVVAGWPGRLVIDADGLNGLDGPDALVGRSGPTVLTPHAGEFRRLAGAAPGYRAAAELAAKLDGVILLKGNPTFVVGRERWVVTSGGPELATIGTGDVLAGFLAALWARGLPSEVAARSAAHRHGRAGAALAGRATVTAEALVDEIGKVAW